MHGRRPTIASTNGMVAAAHPLAAQAGARLLAPGRQRLRRRGGDGGRAQRGRALHVGPRRAGAGDLLGRGRAARARARLRAAGAAALSGRALQPARGAGARRRSRSARPAISPAGASWCARYGRKPLAELFAPAIALARDGFPLVEFNVEEINEHAPAAQALHGASTASGRAPTWAAATASRSGAILTQPELARHARAHRRRGARACSTAARSAEPIVAHLADARRLHDHGRSGSSSARAGRSRSRSTYRGRTVHVPPPPCEGFQFLLTLRILEGFDLAKLERNGVEHLDTVYRAIRLAAGVRIANNNPSPEKLAETCSPTAMSSSCGPACATASRSTGPTEQWIGRRRAARTPATPPRSRSPTATATWSA